MLIGTIWWCFFAVLNQMANLENFIYNIKPNDTILRYLVDITMWVVSSFIFFKKFAQNKEKCLPICIQAMDRCVIFNVHSKDKIK
jgi:hypothetical protein